MSLNTNSDKAHAARSGEAHGWLPGLGLLVVGLVLLVAQFARSEAVGVLIVPALSLVFIVWGAVTREPGFLIPGGVLAGIGAGSVCLVYDWPFGALSGDAEAGVFMLVFAGGWASITLLTAIFTDRVHWWPLVLAGFFALVGGALLVGGTAREALSLVGYLWPLALIALGLYLLMRRRDRTVL
jgi:hypothetical protein